MNPTRIPLLIGRSTLGVGCSTFAFLLGLILVGPGCAHSTRIHGDPLVLAGTAPTNLVATRVRGPLTLRSTYEVKPDTVTYREGVDYTLDAARGTLARTGGSRIPDFTKNVLFNQHHFNHGEHPGYGNLPFTVYADYATTDPAALHFPSATASSFPPAAAAKLRAGQPLKIIAFGDSITAGGDASRPELQYPALFADELRHGFPKSRITLENTATGGDTTRNGLARLQEKVLSRNPDLVLIAFGMNDHNLPSVGGVPLAEFESNLVQITRQIRQITRAECILVSCFDPNPEWAFGTHNMAQYAQATRHAAQTTDSAYADVYALFHQVLGRKDPQSLLANNINHPNDFGHWLYLQALEQVKF